SHYAVRLCPTYAPARQGHQIHACLARRSPASAAQRAEVRLQLAASLRTSPAAEDSRRKQDGGRRALRQFDQQPLQPRAQQRGLLERTELGINVHPLVRIHRGQQRPDQNAKRKQTTVIIFHSPFVI